MAITREAPRPRQPRDPERDPEDRVQTITEPPKPTRSEVALQVKREKAGLSLMQAVAYGAGLLGKFKLLPVLPEDVAAIALHSAPIAKGMADCAAEDEKFAFVFDKLTAFGPYGALFEAVTPLVMQIVTNHNKDVRAGMAPPPPGAVHPDQLLTLMSAQAETMNGQAGSEPS